MSICKIITVTALALIASACSSGPTVSHNAPHGIVVLAPAQPASDNYQLMLLEVDDVRVFGGRDAYWLAPGRHVLRVAAIISNDRPLLRESRETRAEHEADVLEIDIVEGKRYRIAAHRTGPRGGDWEPVVLEVSDIR